MASLSGHLAALTLQADKPRTFLDLPAEIRNRIYEYYFEDSIFRLEEPAEQWSCTHQQGGPPIWTSILAGSKALTPNIAQPASDLHLSVRRKLVVCKTHGRQRKHKILASNKGVSLVQTCRRIFNETQALYFARTHFIIGVDMLPIFLRCSLFKRHLVSITLLHKDSTTQTLHWLYEVLDELESLRDIICVSVAGYQKAIRRIGFMRGRMKTVWRKSDDQIRVEASYVGADATMLAQRSQKQPLSLTMLSENPWTVRMHEEYPGSVSIVHGFQVRLSCS